MIEPLSQKVLDGPLPDSLRSESLGLNNQCGKRFRSIPLGPTESAGEVLLATGQRVSTGMDPQLPRVATPLSHGTRHRSPSILSVCWYRMNPNGRTIGWTTSAAVQW